MPTEIFAVCSLLLLICFLDWRGGLYISIAVGFFQDPLRKLIPGEPVYVSATVAVFLVATFLGVLSSGLRLNRHKLWQTYPDIHLPLSLLIGVVAFQAARTMIKTGSLAISGIGLMGFLLPLAAMFLALEFALRGGAIVKLLNFYILFASIFLFGIFFEAWHYGWPILGSVGEPLYFYAGGPRVLYAGFLRSSEISAWHGALAVMLGITLYTLAPPGMRKYTVIPVAAIVILAIVLTGRRKALAQIGVFIVTAITLMFLGKSHSQKTHIVSMVVGLAAIVLLYQLFDEGVAFSGYDAYLARSRSVAESAFERLSNNAFSSLQWVVRRNGIFGAGAGLGSQGAQHFGGMQTGPAAEGGLAKVLAELGVPGLIILCWFIYRIAHNIWRAIRSGRYSAHDKTLMIGLSSTLLANFLSFAVGHQVHGDPFVLIMSGLIIGFILAIPLLNTESSAKRDLPELT